MKLEFLRLVLFLVALMVPGRAGDSTAPVQQAVRLKIPIKVIKPNAGPGGINVEVLRWGALLRFLVGVRHIAPTAFVGSGIVPIKAPGIRMESAKVDIEWGVR